jgi:hypothetical protein
MAAEIYLGPPGSEPLRTATEYDRNTVALALSGKDDRARRIGGFLELDLNDGNRVLVNPATVTFIRDVAP